MFRKLIAALRGKKAGTAGRATSADFWSPNYAPRVSPAFKAESRRLAERHRKSLKGLADYDRRKEGPGSSSGGRSRPRQFSAA